MIAHIPKDTIEVATKDPTAPVGAPLPPEMLKQMADGMMPGTPLDEILVKSAGKRSRRLTLEERLQVQSLRSLERKRDRQSWLESVLESSADVLSGFLVSILVWLLVIPLFYPEHRSDLGTATGIVVIFTVSSLLRRFAWRRFFEHGLHRAVHRWLRKSGVAILNRTR